MSAPSRPGTRCICGRRRSDHPLASCSGFARSTIRASERVRSRPSAAIIDGSRQSVPILRALLEANAALIDDETASELAKRPRTRGDCKDGPRPCIWGCRYSLAIEVMPSGSIKILHPDGEATESCALDVADRGEHTLDVVGELLNVSRQRAMQIEVIAMRNLKKKMNAQ